MTIETGQVALAADVIKMSRTIYGDGSDGDVTISAPTSLTRDMFYNDLTINNGITLTTAGYRIFVKGTLTNNGTISNGGAAGANAVTGAGYAAGGVAGSGATLGSGGTGAIGSTSGAGADKSGGGGGGGGVLVIAARIIINSSGTIHSNGGAAGTPFAGTANPDAGVAAAAVSPANGGAGGAGGNATVAHAGGVGGTVTIRSSMRAMPTAVLGFETYPTATAIRGGGGGGSGANSNTASNVGGSGGGGGGVVVLIYETATWGTETVTGGVKSAKVGGAAADDGINGSDGIVIKIETA